MEKTLNKTVTKRLLDNLAANIIKEPCTVTAIDVIDKEGKTLAKMAIDKKIDYKKVFGIRVVGRTEKGYRITKFCINRTKKS